MQSKTKYNTISERKSGNLFMDKKTQAKKELDLYYASYHGEKKYVFGEGSLESGIVFIGEAPGADEEATGHPFVGKAGKNLSAFLSAAEIERNNIYITNAVKFRPVKINPQSHRASNRTPSQDEITAYREWLLKELRIAEPKLVVTLGNTPLFAVTGNKSAKISDVHGSLIEYENSEYSLKCALMPFYHPAAIIYRKELASEYEKDMGKFVEAAKVLL